MTIQIIAAETNMRNIFIIWYPILFQYQQVELLVSKLVFLFPIHEATIMHELIDDKKVISNIFLAIWPLFFSIIIVLISLQKLKAKLNIYA